MRMAVMVLPACARAEAAMCTGEATLEPAVGEQIETVAVEGTGHPDCTVKLRVLLTNWPVALTPTSAAECAPGATLSEISIRSLKTWNCFFPSIHNSIRFAGCVGARKLPTKWTGEVTVPPAAGIQMLTAGASLAKEKMQGSFVELVWFRNGMKSPFSTIKMSFGSSWSTKPAAIRTAEAEAPFGLSKCTGVAANVLPPLPRHMNPSSA